MEGLSTEHLFGPLQLAGPGADAQTPEEGYVELGVDAAVEVATSRGDAALPLQYPQMMRANSKAPRCFAYVNYSAVHRKAE